MYKPSAVIITFATSCLLLASSLALADEIPIIDENLDALPSDYELKTMASANATADFQIGNLGTSNGLIFDGTWDVPAYGSEYSLGILQPTLPVGADFQIDPADTGGIASVRWTLDVEVISITMVPPDQGIFVQLYVFQEQSDGSVSNFEGNGHFVVTGQSLSLDIRATESDFGFSGNRPDFSANGGPISFGLVFGAAYPKTTSPNAFYVDGRMTGDNWTVAVTPAGIFGDRFETQPVSPVLAEPTNNKDCLCPAPPSISLDSSR